MITRDLFEMASLDVLGLLDDEERRAFERGFREAPPAVQAQIRREQLRIAEIEEWLPNVAPPPGTKAGVMDAVREAMSAMREGRGREHLTRKVGPLALALQRNVSPLWRAAAIGLATATLLAGYFVLDLRSEVSQVSRLLDNDKSMQEFMRAGVPGITGVLSDASATHIAFVRAHDAPETGVARAGLYRSENSPAYLVCTLPKTPGGYRLVALSDDGSRIASEIARFDPASGQQIITIKGAIPAGSRLAILPATASDDPASAILVTRA